MLLKSINSPCFDIDCLDRLEERYQGEYGSEEDFAEYLVNELYDLDRAMGNLSYYFDYGKNTRELFMCDYTMEDKYVFIND